jgi:hypothetical protein
LGRDTPWALRASVVTGFGPMSEACCWKLIG